MKNHGKCEKTQGYQACNNWSKKELFGIRTKQNNIQQSIIIQQNVSMKIYEQ